MKYVLQKRSDSTAECQKVSGDKEAWTSPTTRWTTIAEWVEDEGEYEEGPESLMNLQVTLASKQMNLPVEQVQKFFRIKEDYREDEDYEE